MTAVRSWAWICTAAGRCIRAALAGEPVPAITRDTQPVIWVLAQLAAASFAARLADLGAEIVAKGRALGYAEHKLSALLLADVLCPPGEPPG
jgi:hypothetical protein